MKRDDDDVAGNLEIYKSALNFMEISDRVYEDDDDEYAAREKLSKKRKLKNITCIWENKNEGILFIVLIIFLASGLWILIPHLLWQPLEKKWVREWKINWLFLFSLSLIYTHFFNGQIKLNVFVSSRKRQFIINSFVSHISSSFLSHLNWHTTLWCDWCIIHIIVMIVNMKR